MNKQNNRNLSVLEISLRTKALYLNTLSIIDKSLVKKYMGVLYPNEFYTHEKVSPIANLILLKFIWWYLKLFESEISKNKNQFALVKYTLFSLFENNFKFSPEEMLNRINKEIPNDVFETNWFEREIVNKINKNEFGVLESLSVISIEKHFSLAKKTWKRVWKLDVDALMDFTGNLVHVTLEDYISRVKNDKTP